MQLSSTRMVLIHQDGSKWVPQLRQNRDTGSRAFRVARPGKGSNKKENTIFVPLEQESRMHNLFLSHDHLVRCIDMRGNDKMFGLGRKSRVITEVLLDGESVWRRS